MISFDDLRGNPLFMGVQAETLAEALAGVSVRERLFETGQRILSQGDEYADLMLLVDGRLAATIERHTGQALLVETLMAPTILAPAVYFAPEPVFPVTLTASSIGRIAAIPRTDVVRLAAKLPSVLHRLLVGAGEKFAFVTTKMQLLHFATIRGKLAAYLLDRLRLTNGDRIYLPYDRTQMAELFGVARPSLSRAIGEMAGDGTISVDGRYVTVPHRGRLQSILESEG